MFGDFGENVFGDFGENVFVDLEKTCSAIWRKHVRRFGETRSAKTLEIWRTCSAKYIGDFILEFVME